MMIKRKSYPGGWFILILFAAICAGPSSTRAHAEPFPSFGSGLIQVRLYTDYFCPPCRGMEPAIKPVLRDLIKGNSIRLTLVDTPFSTYSSLYAKYFLYALNAKNDFEHALLIQHNLYAATTNKHITTPEKIEGLFESKGLTFTAFDTGPVFGQYNILIKEDKINATPSCVIIKNGRKDTYVGALDIIKALTGLR